MTGKMFVISETPEYKVQGELVEGRFALHLRVHKWSVSIYKELLMILGDIMNYAKDRGYYEVYSGAKTEDKKALKCQRMFGFEYWKEHDDMTITYQRLA